MAEEGQNLIQTIRQMEASLDDKSFKGGDAKRNSEPEISYPLVDCLQLLKERHKVVSKSHRERAEQVRSKCAQDKMVTMM